MKTHSTYSIIIGIILLACAWYLNDAFQKETPSSKGAQGDDKTITARQLIDRKNLHTDANQINRKPYVIRSYNGLICAERIERSGSITSTPFIESYCYSKYGPMPQIWPPDSLKQKIHYQMIDSLHHHAIRKGWREAWRSPLEGSPPQAGGVSSTPPVSSSAERSNATNEDENH